MCNFKQQAVCLFYAEIILTQFFSVELQISRGGIPRTFYMYDL